MISYRRADLLDMINQGDFKPLVFVTKDKRDMHKFYNAETRRIIRPEAGINIPLEDLYTNNFKIIERDGVYLLLNYIEVADFVGLTVRLQGNVLGECNSFSPIDGTMRVVGIDQDDVIIDPLEFVIELWENNIVVELIREPFKP